ncbi:G-type lectin S-receptor-like serine/threonine-protein kinase [Platanthera zijinensis]|uniref:Receptor-like serine/threonine-protein kinase n=1 Tax=Platanthera zijinensis TaxID=2320716 RepID=A0AAP0BPM8_9ASPA
MSELIIPAFVLFFTFVFVSISIAVDTLTPSRQLFDGETLVSANGTFALGFFSPLNTTNRYLGIWYHNLAVHTIVWVANRRIPLTNLTGILSITTAGSLHVTSTLGNSRPVWSTPSFPNSSPNLISQLLDSGNLVVKSVDSRSILWQSFDYPTDTMLPGMKLGPHLTTGLDRNLTAWRSPSDPSPGNYTVGIDALGVPQIVMRTADGWIWRGGPWNGLGFSGAGTSSFFDVGLYRLFHSGFNVTEEEIYYYFNTVNDGITTVTMDYNGTLRRYEWDASNQNWNIDWLAPIEYCDFFPACGANGVCDGKSSPVCRCVEGFDPRNPVSWSRGDWSDGCVRAAPLGCHANVTDDFVVVRGAKLPDTREAVEDMSIDLDECRARCLMNCSCQAYASADLSVDLSQGGSGCIIWTADIDDVSVYANGGQNFFLRVPSESELYEQSISSLNLENEIMHKLEAGKERNSEIPLFQFIQVTSATNNFSDTNKLGEGGFGPVYKGKLPEGQDVAIKRLSARSGQGAEEFKNELMLIAKLQHRNLVRLLGCCIHAEEKMLIYEFMPNKSLDLFLFNVEQGRKLDWTRRFHIVEGIAQGLLYLHKHSRLRVIHRDLKASNILLDADMNPKISDFGLARIFDANQTQANTRRIVGTFGYISPEYAFKGLFSVKSDVFSFGVLLLEIVSGRRSAGLHEFGSSCSLLAYAWDLWKDEAWAELVDPALDKKFQHDEAARCIYVALLCVQESADDRPDMSDVVSILGNENLCFSGLKEPAFFSMKLIASDLKHPFELHVNNSLNNLSVSDVAGR